MVLKFAVSADERGWCLIRGGIGARVGAKRADDRDPARVRPEFIREGVLDDLVDIARGVPVEYGLGTGGGADETIKGGQVRHGLHDHDQ